VRSAASTSFELENEPLVTVMKPLPEGRVIKDVQWGLLAGTLARQILEILESKTTLINGKF